MAHKRELGVSYWRLTVDHSRNPRTFIGYEVFFKTSQRLSGLEEIADAAVASGDLGSFDRDYAKKVRRISSEEYFEYMFD